MRRVLVTGGAGFIGSLFARMLFERGEDEIVVYDSLTYAGRLDNLPRDMQASPRFEFVYGDIRNGGMLSRVMANVDVVVHFAAETHVTRSIHDAVTFLETDVIGTANILAAAVQYRSRIERVIHISTSEVYGTLEGSESMTERHPLEPHTPYASAKAGADRLVYSYWKTYGLPATIARPFNNYGYRQHLEKVVPRFITSALLGEPLTVHGDGSSTRDWVFVEDTCSAVLALLDAPRERVIGETFNIGTGVETSIRDIAELVIEATSASPHLMTFGEERPGQVERHRAGTGKLEALCGWRARTDFRDGLVRTIQWYRENEAFWEPMRWMRRIRIERPSGDEWF